MCGPISVKRISGWPNITGAKTASWYYLCVACMKLHLAMTREVQLCAKLMQFD